MGNSVSSIKFKVLFVGTHFKSGFEYTKISIETMLRNSINNKLGNISVDVVCCERDDLLKEIPDTTILVPLMSKITKNIIEHAPNLRLIMQFGVGLEGIDVEAATDAGVYVSNIESMDTGNAASCAEHAIFLATSVLRNQFEMNVSTKNSKLGTPIGQTLLQSCIMIYGYGNISKQLILRLLSFQPKHIMVMIRNIKKYDSITADANIDLDLDQNSQTNQCTDHTNNKNRYKTLIKPYSEVYSEQYLKCLQFFDVEQFDTLAVIADVLFLCCSQNESNIRFVNEEFIGKLNNECIIVNVARGGLINYQDALKALNSGRLKGIGVDVYETEPFPINDDFLNHPKVVCTPHVAGVTEISYRNMANLVANNVLNVIEDRVPVGVVNKILT